jgi:cell division protein FtsN
VDLLSPARSNTNPTCVAATNELIKEQTELEKQRMLIAQQQQEQNEISLENQRVIDNINAAQSQDTSSSENGGSSSSSTSNGEVTEEEDKHDIQIEISITEDMWVQGACGNSKLV